MTKPMKKYLFLLLCWISLSAWADGIFVLHANGIKTSDGKLVAGTRFHVDLPEQLHNVLEQGVPLYFDLDYEITKPTLMAYKIRINQWFEQKNIISYKLTYHPLTDHYRVSIGTFYTEYPTLDSALKALGSVVNWQILPSGTLADKSADEVRASVRLGLSIRRLPKPFQINALTSQNWDLDSGWVALNIVGD